MNKGQLFHLGADILGENSFVIVGTQAILLTSIIVARADRPWREVQGVPTP